MPKTNPALFATPWRAKQRSGTVVQSHGLDTVRGAAIIVDSQGAWIATTGDMKTARMIAALVFDTASRVYSHEHAQVVTLALIEASQWFRVTPLPFDKYEIAVKAENKHLLKDAGAFLRVATKI